MRHLLNSLCITLFCLAAPVVRAAGVKTTCLGCELGELAFARSEIDAFFAPAIAGTELEGNCRIRLECDPSIDDGSFGYRSEDGRRITVYGGDPISVTNGLHTLLERMGFLFDITGVTRPEPGRSGGARPCRRADPSQCPVAGYPAARELPDGHILLPDRSGQALSGEPRAHALQQVRGSQLHFHVARRAGFAGFDQLCRQFLLRTPPRLLRQSLPEIRQSREPVDLLHPGYRTLLRRCARTEQTGRRLDGRAARLRQVARTLCPVLLRAAPFDRRTCRPPRADHRPDLSPDRCAGAHDRGDRRLGTLLHGRRGSGQTAGVLPLRRVVGYAGHERHPGSPARHGGTLPPDRDQHGGHPEDGVRSRHEGDPEVRSGHLLQHPGPGGSGPTTWR